MRNRSLPLHAAARPAPVEPTLIAILAVAAAAAAIVGPTLIALTHGWDYRLAVLLGAGIAVAVLVCVRGRLSEADRAGRLSLEFTGAFAASLVCVYAADWLDWRPFGIDDALAGMVVGLALLLAGPTRRALYHAGDAPDEATFALWVLVGAPAVASYIAYVFGSSLVVASQAGRLVLCAGFGASVVVAWLGTAFALRRGLYEAAFVLAALSGLALFAFLDGSGLPATDAALFGALAGAWLVLVVFCFWQDSARSRSGRADGSLVGLAIASVASLAVGAAPIAWFAAGGVLGTWWWCYYRKGLPLFPPGSRRVGARRAIVSLAFNVPFAAIVAAHGFLLGAAANNATGPMLLASIEEIGLYRVSDLTFSEALFADQYLWRDEPAPSRFVAAASPERLVRLMRTDRDRWSGVMLVASRRTRESRESSGVGLVPGQEVDAGVQVAYVYPGSPADRAGVRRGDVIRAIDGAPASALRIAYLGSSARLELAAAGQPARAVTLAPDAYSRPAVSDEKVLEAGGRRVGYVVLHDFDASAGKAFSNAAERLREAGIDELVLDLRMNPGGRVSVARDIASAIGGRRLDGQAFQRIEHNARYRDSDHDVPFRAPERGVLSLPRLFVITSEESCSASEALINGLAPHMTVVTVGTTTCGKPVGMTVVEYGKRAYWVITFRVLNGRGEGDYYAGLQPTCRVADDFAHDLGDPAEVSLSAALHYMRYGRCPQGPVNARAEAHAANML